LRESDGKTGVVPFEFAPASLEWLRDPEHPPVDATWVPGALEDERRSLRALGGIARALLGNALTTSLHPDLAAWLSAAPTPPQSVVDDAQRLFATDRDEALASMYAQLVRSENRRQLGTFFTPAPEVRLMLDLWTESDQPVPATVVDVGAGVGVFTAEAAKRWPESAIHAVDVNPVTLGLLAIRLLAAPESETEDQNKRRRIRLVLDDFTNWISTGWPATGSGRLILGNPPYTRAQLLSLEDRKRLHTAIHGLCGTRASLSTIITALSLQNLSDDDGLCLLLPAQWLETDYAKGLRLELWEQTHRRVELRLVDSVMFDDAQVDAVALLVGVKRSKQQPFVVGKWKQNSPRQIDRGDTVPRSWRSLFEIDENTEAAKTKDDDPAAVFELSPEVTLGDLAVVHRGVATGANAFFVLDEATKDQFPRGATTRVITRLFGLADSLEEEARKSEAQTHTWLLTATERQASDNSTLRDYVKTGTEHKYDQRHLCSKRETWYDLTSEVFVPDVIVGAMTRGTFRLVQNDVGATITNNLYGIRWRPSTTDETRSRTLDWLRSESGQNALSRAARRQGDKLLKIEPGALRKIVVPDATIEGTD
jgi:adenine-specific DNA-methyltransferase